MAIVAILAVTLPVLGAGYAGTRSLLQRAVAVEGRFFHRFGELLSGFYRPQAGRVLLDGQAIDDDTRPGYRACFATVFTDSHLFERLYGRPEIDPADVNRGLAKLGLAGKTRYMEAGFSNLALSIGQKKRIALLAALLEERPVIVLEALIIASATSAGALRSQAILA